MSTQELLTYLFNAKPCVRACAIALGFSFIAAMDFALRLVAAYKQISLHSSSPLTSTQQPSVKLPLVTIPQVLSQLPDPWLLPVEDKANISTKTFPREQKHLRLLPQAKETSMVVAPKLEDLLTGVD